MRNTQALKEFISKWKFASLPSKEMLYEYKPFCRNLLFEDEEVVRDAIGLLKTNIERWATSFSHAYAERKEFVSRTELSDKDSWYVHSETEDSQPMASSGSTTGTPFRYLRWEPFLYFIEGENHYDLIMDEFGMPDRPRILYMFSSNQYDDSRLVTVRDDSRNFMEHHGTSRKAEVHYVNFKRMKEDQAGFFGDLIPYLQANQFDVIFAPGPSINSMCHYLSKNECRRKICRLVSNTNERLLPEDASFLLENISDDVCDHMRCWDGGATFFTCKHKNYHLMDNLSWCEEIDGRLLSTDYFSIPSPFVRYWNGDRCRMGDSYARCECGRLYREFEFLENRPFSLKGMCLNDLKRAIEKINSKSIKQVRCGLNTIDIISSEEIPEFDKGEVLKTTDKFEFRFIVEN
jgi:hypothetical protein